MRNNSLKRFDLLVHIGAGACREAERHLENAARVILVEPNLDTVKALQERFSGQSRIEVVGAAVGFDEAERQFMIRNLPDFSGFFEPTSLKRFFRGLSDKESIEIYTHDASAFLADLVDDTENDIALIVDVNGAEYDILESLKRDDWLSRLAAVTVYCGDAPLFDGALTVEGVVSNLEPFGEVSVEGVGPMRRVQLEAAGLDRDDEPPITKSTLVELEQRLTQEIQRVRAAESEARKANETLRANITEVQIQLDSARAELNHERLEREAKVKNETAALTLQNEHLNDELDQLRTSLDERRSELLDFERETDGKKRQIEALSSELTGIKTQLGVAISDRDRLKSETDALRAEASQLRAKQLATDKELLLLREEHSKVGLIADEEAAQLRAQVSSLREKLNANEQRLESLECTNQDLVDRCDGLSEANRALEDVELPRVRSDLAVALRGRAMADADLRSLRAKHAELVEAKRDREELLSLISERLRQASAYMAFEAEERAEALVLEDDDIPGAGSDAEKRRPSSSRKKKR